MSNEEKQKKIEELRRKKAEINRIDEERRKKKLDELRSVDRLAQNIINTAQQAPPPTAAVNQAPVSSGPARPAVKLNFTSDSFQLSIPPKDRPEMYECGIQCAIQTTEKVKKNRVFLWLI